MSRRKFIPIRNPLDVPENMSEVEARIFWDTHEITEEYFQRARPLPEDTFPQDGVRSTHVALRIPADTLRRVKALARKKGRGYQTLIKEFLVERLYEEERREGILPAEQRS